MKAHKLEICIVDYDAVLTSRTILDFRRIRFTNHRDANKHMEDIAKKEFERWEWRKLNPDGIYPNGIVDLDTGNCLIFR
jgi:hypothetical protein